MSDTRAVLAVIGNGMVSQRFCERCVELGLHRTRRIIVFGEEALPAYNRVQLTSVLAGQDTASLILKPMLWYADHDIDLRLDERVVAIDREQRSLATQLGELQHYDQLVFATGSFPAVPNIPGTQHPGVFVYRTTQDVKRIRSRATALARARGRVAVIGSGLLGIEAGQAIKELGCDVTFIESARHMLPRQLDPATASIVADMLLHAGFDLCIGQTVQRILLLSEMRHPRFTAISNRPEEEESDARLRVELGDGGLCRAIECGMVILAVGVKPRDEIARAAGIVCPAPGGIQVDAELRTNDQHVFAIGECARHAGQCYGLIAPGYAMAEVLAERLAGKSATFSKVQQNTRLNVAHQEIVVMGESSDSSSNLQPGKREALVNRSSTEDTYRRLVLREGHLVGAAAIGPWSELPRLQQAITARAKLRRDERKRFAHGGALWGKALRLSLANWPESATVCACTGVSYGALCRAKEQGCTTVEQLCERTRAGTVCGTCRPLLTVFATGESSLPAPRFHLLFALTGLCVLVALGAALHHGPIALGDSVRGGELKLDVLWRHPLARTITGFTLAGFCALSAGVLTLRKRWGRLAKLDFATFRSFHGVLGVLTLACAGAHTGLRFGRGLDFALVASLLAMMVMGALTALFVASDRLLASPMGQRLRRSGARLHLWLAWPIPVLLLFHVLRSYYF